MLKQLSKGQANVSALAAFLSWHVVQPAISSIWRVLSGLAYRERRRSGRQQIVTCQAGGGERLLQKTGSPLHAVVLPISLMQSMKFQRKQQGDQSEY